jgi:hypothetical protein
MPLSYGTARAGSRGLRRSTEMEYKGITYTVVQTANPTGWKWSFRIPGKPIKSGTASSRAIAIVRAHTAIDQAIKVKRRPKPTTQ